MKTSNLFGSHGTARIMVSAILVLKVNFLIVPLKMNIHQPLSKINLERFGSCHTKMLHLDKNNQFDVLTAHAGRVTDLEGGILF